LGTPLKTSPRRPRSYLAAILLHSMFKVEKKNTLKSLRSLVTFLDTFSYSVILVEARFSAPDSILSVLSALSALSTSHYKNNNYNQYSNNNPIWFASPFGSLYHVLLSPIDSIFQVPVDLELVVNSSPFVPPKPRYLEEKVLSRSLLP
jgi:hypothetical protein